LWRLALENRLSAINRQVKFTKKEIKQEFDLSPKEADMRKSVVKQMRPMLRSSIAAVSPTAKIPLRVYNEQDDFK
jgi:hypothetical protein